MIRRPIVLINGKLSELPLEDEIESIDHHSGRNTILENETVLIREYRQSINFTMLTLDGVLNIEGDLCLA